LGILSAFVGYLLRRVLCVVCCRLSADAPTLFELLDREPTVRPFKSFESLVLICPGTIERSVTPPFQHERFTSLRVPPSSMEALRTPPPADRQCARCCGSRASPSVLLFSACDVTFGGARGCFPPSLSAEDEVNGASNGREKDHEKGPNSFPLQGAKISLSQVYNGPKGEDNWKQKDENEGVGAHVMPQLLVISYWLLVIGYWLLVIGY